MILLSHPFGNANVRAVLNVLQESGLLARYGAVQVASVAHILHTQIQVIELLRQKVDDGVLEDKIHQIVSSNIWLLRSSLTYWFENKAFATKLGAKMAKTFDFAKRRRPDLVCFDDRKLLEKPGLSPKRLVVVEFKRPGVQVGTKELSQVMQYKNVFAESLADVPADGISVVILGDRFDPSFDRSGLSDAYTILSYEELLANARDRYGELYDMLVPEGVPSS